MIDCLFIIISIAYLMTAYLLIVIAEELAKRVRAWGPDRARTLLLLIREREDMGKEDEREQSEDEKIARALHQLYDAAGEEQSNK